MQLNPAHPSHETLRLRLGSPSRRPMTANDTNHCSPRNGNPYVATTDEAVGMVRPTMLYAGESAPLSMNSERLY